MILLDKKVIVPTIFPDKTSQIWKIKIPKHKNVCIQWNFEREDEFIHIAQLKTLLDNEGIYTNLLIYYLPYARQDKLVSNENTFALHTFVKMLNNLEFNSVQIYDPHSEVAFEANGINNAKKISPLPEIENTIKIVQPEIICFPDDGALLKYRQILGDIEYIYGKKKRNQSTGEILEYELFGEVKKSVLIIDDICDGGATFIHLAKALKAEGVENIYLHVSYGLFTKGTQILKDVGIIRIFTRLGEIK